MILYTCIKEDRQNIIKRYAQYEKKINENLFYLQ